MRYIARLAFCSFVVVLALLSTGCPAPTLTTVPDLTGMTQAQAENALAQADLFLGNVTLLHDPATAGDVIDQDPAPGLGVATNTFVDIVVSLGPEESHQAGDTATFGGVEFVWCPPGQFTMGAPGTESESEADERPQHLVTLNYGFWLSKYEVTQALWQSVMGSNPSWFSGVARPVEQVSWNDAQSFIAAFNAAHPGLGVRLPTDAEWEYACRAGTTSAFYWGGDAAWVNAPTYSWTTLNSGSQTHNIGLKSANAWGLFDMAGNVYEFVQDKYHATYTGAPSNGSAWEDAGATQRTLRGGGYYGATMYVRSAARQGINPTNVHADTGFRLLKP